MACSTLRQALGFCKLVIASATTLKHGLLIRRSDPHTWTPAERSKEHRWLVEMHQLRQVVLDNEPLTSILLHVAKEDLLALVYACLLRELRVRASERLCRPHNDRTRRFPMYKLFKGCDKLALTPLTFRFKTDRCPPLKPSKNKL